MGRRRRGLILFVVVPGRYFVSHRIPLVESAIEAGWDVHVAVPAGTPEDEIRNAAVTVHRVNLARGVGPIRQELGSLFSLFLLCRKLQPTIIHTLGPKATVFGGLVGRSLKIPTVMARGGFGAPEIMPGLKNRMALLVIRCGIALSLSKRAVLIAQNEDERQSCIVFKRQLARSQIVAGAGVNCDSFKPSDEPEGPLKVLFLGRLLRNKGVVDFVEAARLVKSRLPETLFVLAGDIDPGSSSTITREEIVGWESEGVVQWVGHRTDIPELLSSCHVVCLPSYAEGLPKSLTEASAAGRCIVTTDAPGCRDVVTHDVNGMLTTPGSIKEIADALLILLQSRELRQAYSAAGRERALSEFDQRVITARILSVYETLARPYTRTREDRVEKYFANLYPNRSSVVGRLLSRHSEIARRMILRDVIGSLEGLTVLDAGCGDGEVLPAVISGRPRGIRLEDLHAANIEKASISAGTLSNKIVSITGDSFSSHDRADVVLAIGLLDYRHDCGASLDTLRRRATKFIVATLPRHHPRNWARLAWFGALGIPFSIASRRQAISIASHYDHFELVKGPFEWVIRLDLPRGGGRNAPRS